MSATPTSPSALPAIWLASRSPRRRELLDQLGIVYDVLSFEIDETSIPNETTRDYVLRIATCKAETGWQQVVQRRLAERPVLAADTSVVADGEILGKPGTPERALAMLRKLSGRSHQVMTAVAIAWRDRIDTDLSVSEVVFADIEDSILQDYAHGKEPLDKAGAYAIQGQAARFVRHLSGSYSGVMGLPAFETVQLLERLSRQEIFSRR